MKNITPKIFIGLLILCFFCKTTGYSQTIIDYSTWNPSSPPCNLFATSTNVPATTNGTAVSIAHQSTIGQPTYNTTSQVVDMGCQTTNSGSIILGTEYQIAYNFKAGYSYKITVTAYCNNSNPLDNNSSVRCKLNNGGSGTSTLCTGPANIDPSTSGNLTGAVVITADATPSPFDVNFSTLPADQAYLNIAAIPAANTGYEQIEIQKITITVTGTPDFALSPTSLSETCGNTTPQTFTLTNTYNYPNVTSYDWNLGSSSNGWLYNGTAAPQIIPTTTNTLTLTPDCGNALQNVSVTVNVNGTPYKTYHCTVSNIIPTYSILGDDICTGSQTYSLSPGLSCNATATWSVSPSGIVSLSSTSGSSTTATRVGGSADVILTANIAGACSTGSIPVQRGIHVGGPNGSTGYLTINSNQYSDGATASLQRLHSYIIDYTDPSGSSSYTWSLSNNLQLQTGQGTNEASILVSGTVGSFFSIAVQPVNTCGTGSGVTISGTIASGTGGGDLSVTDTTILKGDATITTAINIYPNPVNSVLYVSLPDTGIFKGTIKLLDATGKQVKTVMVVAQTTAIDIAGLAKGIYFVEVNNGTTRNFTKKILKN